MDSGRTSIHTRAPAPGPTGPPAPGATGYDGQFDELRRAVTQARGIGPYDTGIPAYGNEDHTSVNLSSKPLHFTQRCTPMVGP